LDSSYSMAHMWLGLVLDATQGPKAAFEEYRAAHRSDPLHPVINGNLARALAQMGRYDDARSYLQRSEQANPDSSTLRMHLSWLDSYYGRHDESVRWALSATENSDKAADKMRMLLAISFATMGDIDRATSFLAEGNPETISKQDFDVRAIVLFAGGEYSRLLNLAKARIAHHSEQDADYAGLSELAWSGVAQIAQGDHAAAASDLSDFLVNAKPKHLEAPRHITILGLLAYSYDQVGDPQRRDEFIARSLEVYERERVRGWASPAFHAAIAGTYALQGDREAAVDELATAARQGWRDHYWMQVDPRFTALRGDPDYEASVSVMRDDLDAMLERASEIVDAQLTAKNQR
ncbi:MAG: tetratricopeptide repeat protein, partial [Gammaproteobacteria bacterium]|nr:tetratricopeptide repeat protein [Gammaproteobacteria bacterium]